MSKIFSITEGLENLGALKTGGQGSVYKAKRGKIISAVKILPTPIHSENEEDKNYRDFQNEVSKLKKVNETPNSHVVKILSSGISESGSLPFIEMEFIEGPDLADLVEPPNDKTFTVTETVKVADQLSNALSHCHKFQVKHGDIKSNNVKLNTLTDNYILLDFGLSIMSDEQRRTSLRHAGAIEFMAPEQNDGELLLESDVYSFGIILFELLAGSVPFPLNNKSETSRNAVMISHMEKPVPDLITIRKMNLPLNWDEEKKESELNVPQWLINVISKCLEKRPSDRFRNGIELHEAISGSISGKRAFAYVPVVGATPEETPLGSNQFPGYIPPSEDIKHASSSTLFGFHPKKGYTKPNHKSISKRQIAVLGAIVLVILLAIFAGYSGLRKPGLVTTDTAALSAENQRLLDSLSDLESQRISDSIADAERLRAQQLSYQSQIKSAQASHGKSKGNSKGKGKGKGKKKK